MSKEFFHSQKESIEYQFDSFIDDYVEQWGPDSLKVCDVFLVWYEFLETLDLNTDLNDCYNIRNIPGVDDEFILLREFCSCNDPCVDAEWEIDLYIDYILENPEEFFRVYKQYEDRVEETSVRSSWGTPSGGYFTSIVNGIPVPDYTSATFSCKEKLLSMRYPNKNTGKRTRQALLSAFPTDEMAYTTIFGRHVAAYHGGWVDELAVKRDSKFEPMRPLIPRWNSVLVKPKRSFAIGDRHGKVSPCLVPGCGGWSNPRLGTYALEEELEGAANRNEERTKALAITVKKSEDKLKKSSEKRRERRKNKMKTAKEKRAEDFKKEEDKKRKQLDAAVRALHQLDIEYVGVEPIALLNAIVEKIRALRPFKVNIQRLQNIKNYFSSENIEAQEKLDILILSLKNYFKGKQTQNHDNG